MLLERLHGDQRWENRPLDQWKIEDLEVPEITRTVEESIRRGRGEDPGTRDPEALLRGFGLLKDGLILRAAGVLFGRSDRLAAELPQCLLRVARFRGTDRTEFLDNRQFHGNGFELLARAERFLLDSLPVAGRFKPGLFERLDDPLYPPLALREALANAICHRDYSIGGGSVGIAVYDDRLEVTSSGTLHFGLTVEDLFRPHESLPWNPLIARVLYRRGVIEQWGRGTLKIVELVQEAGMPTPEIEDVAGSVTIRFRPARYLAPQRVAHDLTDRQQAILAALAGETFGMALRDVRRNHPEASESDIKKDLTTLKTLDLVETRGHGRGAVWRLRGGR
jgi:ATP-dependent DNA helicase RecG